MTGYSSAQWKRAVDKLINMTEQGELDWEESSTFRGGAYDQLDDALEVFHSGKVYVIARARRREWYSDEDFHWAPFYDLSIYERRSSGMIKLATAPDMISLYALYSAARDMFAKNSGALDDLL